MNTIQQGSSGPDVLTWQTYVLKLDFPDGVFGPATKSATQDWQSKNGLPADGVVGPMSWAKAGYGTSAPATSHDVYQTYVPQPGDFGYKVPGPENTGSGTRVAAPKTSTPVAVKKPAISNVSISTVKPSFLQTMESKLPSFPVLLAVSLICVGVTAAIYKASK